MRALVFLFVLSFTVPALADVVMPEPDSCPPGSTPSTAHSGPYCRPTEECSSDSVCGEGSSCEAVSQCVETRACGGLMPPDAAPCTIEHIVGACDSSGNCAVGECRMRDVCTGGGSSGGGCSAGHGAGAGALALAIAIVLFAWRRRA